MNRDRLNDLTDADLDLTWDLISRQIDLDSFDNQEHQEAAELLIRKWWRICDPNAE